MRNQHNDGRNLILLFGLPRSGTTWVGKVFDSHPDVVYRHEPEAVSRIEGLPVFVEESDFDQYARVIRDYAQGLMAMSNPRVVGKLPLLPKRYLGPVRFRLHQASVLLATTAGRISVPLPLYNPARHLAPDRVHLVWKSVTGLGRLPAIVHTLPSCRAIIIQRHPCGVVASQIRGLTSRRFGAAAPLSERTASLRERQRKELKHRYALTDEEMDNLTVEERFAWRWVLAHERVLERVSDLSGCTTVWYDDLCREPMEGYRRLFEFAGLDWPDATTRFLDQTITRENDDYYSVFKNPLNSANRWREELSDEAINRILEVARRSWAATRLFDAPAAQDEPAPDSPAAPRPCTP